MGLKRGDTGWDECDHCVYELSLGEEESEYEKIDGEAIIEEIIECQHPDGPSSYYGDHSSCMNNPDICDNFKQMK